MQIIIKIFQFKSVKGVIAIKLNRMKKKTFSAWISGINDEKLTGETVEHTSED